MRRGGSALARRLRLDSSLLLPNNPVTKGGLETHPTVGYVLGMFRIAVFLLLLSTLPLRAEEALVAVAANFLRPAEVLAEAYEAASGHEISLASGSTGQHYAQIVHGAPYDLFLAADEARPALLTADGLAGEPETYAVGRLAYVSPMFDPTLEWFEGVDEAELIAIANPDLAPYGRAAREALEAKDLWDHVTTVQGQNVGQAYAFVASGNVRGGLVALSLAVDREGFYAVVPSDLHAPIRQDAVLLNRGKGNLAAEGFLDYLGSDDAVRVLEEFGYLRP